MRSRDSLIDPPLLLSSGVRRIPLYSLALALGILYCLQCSTKPHRPDIDDNCYVHVQPKTATKSWLYRGCTSDQIATDPDYAFAQKFRRGHIIYTQAGHDGFSLLRPPMGSSQSSAGKSSR